MRKNPYFINILLMVTMGIICLGRLMIGVFSPATVLPSVGIPFLVAVSVIPMILEHYVVKETQREYIGAVLLAGITTALLPVCTGLEMNLPVWKLFVVGAGVFFVTDICFGAIEKRLSGIQCVKIAPVANGLMLYLASQCFQGLL